MVKIEEVKLKLNSNDLSSLNLESEKIDAELNDFAADFEAAQNVEEKNNKKAAIKKPKHKLFFKILMFQFVVSSFVFLILFSLKKIYPAKFKTISAQLSLAINEGPKFYEGLGSKINELNRNFSLQTISNKNKVQTPVKNTNMVKNNNINFNIKNDDYYGVPVKNESLKINEVSKKSVDSVDSLKFAIDDFESNSHDGHDDDVFFLNLFHQ